jgi:hypothetical protein
MPKLLDTAASKIKAGDPSLPRSSAYAIATNTLQKSGSLKPGSDKLTAQGRARSAMTPAQRQANPPKGGGTPHHSPNLSAPATAPSNPNRASFPQSHPSPPPRRGNR